MWQWYIIKHGTSKIIDTLETYQGTRFRECFCVGCARAHKDPDCLTAEVGIYSNSLSPSPCVLVFRCVVLPSGGWAYVLCFGTHVGRLGPWERLCKPKCTWSLPYLSSRIIYPHKVRALPLNEILRWSSHLYKLLDDFHTHWKITRKHELCRVSHKPRINNTKLTQDGYSTFVWMEK